MSKPKQKPFRVFYSWQDDLDSKTNKNFIRRALHEGRELVNEIPEYRDIDIVIDEATRDEPGSPNIPTTILKKIQTADAFICDITTVNNDAPDHYRKVPNPNVVFELGYAVALLGWGRIVMVFNKAFGSFPTDLPFDFDRHRASPYRQDPQGASGEADAKTVRDSRTELARLCKDAIQQILLSNPERPAILSNDSPSILRRRRDVDTLRYLLANIHVPTLDEYVERLPRYCDDSVLYFWEGFNAMWQSSLTYFYDDKLKCIFDRLHSLWKETCSYDEHYEPSFLVRGQYIFTTPGDLPLDDRRSAAWEKIEHAARALKTAVRDLTVYIRQNYTEIDLKTTNNDTWARYVELYRDAR